MGVLYVLGIVSFFTILYQFIIIIITSKKLKYIKKIKINTVGEYPFISVIISAKDEGEDIEYAISSRLKTDYPNIEFIIVNDRSKDRTGDIIDAVAIADKRVRVIHIKNLPKGWLGKVNALNEGQKIAKGEWLLFSDGDVIIEQGTMKKAVNYCVKNKIEFLAVLPEIIGSSFFVNIPVSIFFRSLMTFGRAFKVNDEKSNVSVGSGSFNLVKRAAFESIDGFNKLKMEVIDDVALGQLLKLNGAKSSMLVGKGFVKVRWYNNLKSLFNGMGRAMMTGIGNFNILQLIVLSTFAFLIDIIPFFLLIPFGQPLLQIIGVVNIIIITVATIISDKILGRSFHYSLFLPIGYILIYLISIYGGLKDFINGGLIWRDTFYSVKDLKKGRVFKFFPKK